MTILGDLIQSADWKNEKHVPVIELPTGAKPDKSFDVTVTVGKEIPHPNTTSHHIQWVSLYFKPANGKFAYNLGRADFLGHGASTEGPDSIVCHTEPQAVFKVRLDQPGTLVAASYCNIHGLWESSLDVNP